MSKGEVDIDGLPFRKGLYKFTYKKDHRSYGSILRAFRADWFNDSICVECVVVRSTPTSRSFQGEKISWFIYKLSRYEEEEEEITHIKNVFEFNFK